ncbi:hypothetical protein BRC2024_KCUCJSVR_CDS_0183 [Acinetobacter phage vB_AbaM_KissB]
MENAIVIGLSILIIALVVYFLGKRHNRKLEGAKDLVFYDSKGNEVDFQTLLDKGAEFKVQATPIKTLENRNPEPVKVNTLPKIGEMEASKLPLSRTKVDRDDSQTIANNNFTTTVALATMVAVDSNNNSGICDSAPSYSSGSSSSCSSDSGSSSSDSGSSSSSYD